MEKKPTKRYVASLYRKAAALIDQHPKCWVRGIIGFGTLDHPDHAKFCAVGAVGLAEFGIVGWPLYRAKEAEILQLGCTLPTYNDSRAGGPKDVAKALRKVARALEHGAPL